MCEHQLYCVYQKISTLHVLNVTTGLVCVSEDIYTACAQCNNRFSVYQKISTLHVLNVTTGLSCVSEDIYTACAQCNNRSIVCIRRYLHCMCSM